LLAGQAYFLGSTRTGSGVGQYAASSRVAELEAEVAQLRADLGKAKGINDSMWETMVNTILPKTNGSVPSAETEADFMVVDDEPRAGTVKAGDGRKRARKGI
jgi:pre-rRNA-processing protein IPI3